jgi:hypothetical protein
MRRAEAERLEQAVRSLSREGAERFIGWLSTGGEGDLWDWLKPKSAEGFTDPPMFLQ